MTRASYSDELMRASARPDVAALRALLGSYHDWSQRRGRDAEAYLQEHDELDAWHFVGEDDPDKALALIALAASMFDDRAFLFLIAAEPLEELLRKPSDEILDRVVAEARKHARFRWMLTGVYLHAIGERVRPHIVAVIGTMTEDQPTPPRPG